MGNWEHSMIISEKMYTDEISSSITQASFLQVNTRLCHREGDPKMYPAIMLIWVEREQIKERSG